MTDRFAFLVRVDDEPHCTSRLLMDAISEAVAKFGYAVHATMTYEQARAFIKGTDEIIRDTQ